MRITSEQCPTLIPRIIRFRDAPFYLGMDKNRFNKEVRPFITEIKIGTQGIAFDRLDLDAWVDDYKSRVGRPGTRKLRKNHVKKDTGSHQEERHLAHQQSHQGKATLRKHWIK